MTAAKKITVKSLAEEFEKLKEEVEELRPLKQKVAYLEEKLKMVHLNDENVTKSYVKCKKCEMPAESVKELKTHMKVKHPVEVSCKICAESFVKNSDLEEHIRNLHEDKEKHECDECGKTFVLKWRLKKHMNIHTSSEIKSCHYYNNGKTCPYEEIGCMFAHKVSGLCKYKMHCRNKLCSFQHQSVSESQTEFPCQECEETLSDHDSLIEHVEIVHVTNGKMHRDHLFPQKCPNCPKWIYCDEENESHYDDFEEYGRCEYRKTTT